MIKDYYLIILSILSSKILDIFYLIINAIFNAILWENFKIDSINYDSTDLCELLNQLSTTYYFCSDTRIKYKGLTMPTGFIFGKNYFVHLNITYNSSSRCYNVIIILYGWFSINSLIKIKKNNQNKYKICEISNNGYYIKRTENYPDCNFHKNSEVCAKFIKQSLDLTHYNSGVYLLYGFPGTGKTLTSKKLYNLCNDDSIIYMIDSRVNLQTVKVNILENLKIDEQKNNSLIIVVMDEIDERINKIYNSSENEHTTTKYEWNNFLDFIHSQQNVALLLTTNKTKKFFDEHDVSLLREYRLTALYEFNEHDVFKI